MIGITSYGAYIPWYRMEKKVVARQMSWFAKGDSKGEKAVVNYDEDSITMANAASINCLEGIKRDSIDGLYMASMSFPFSNRQNAGVVASSLNLKNNVRTADYTSALKNGSDALLAGIDSVASGNLNSVLVCSGESRAPKPGSAGEYSYGDGASALLIGNKNVIAEYKGSYSSSYDFLDSRKMSNEQFDHAWEDRWIREEAVLKFIPEAVKGLLEKTELQVDDISKFVIAVPNQGNLTAVTKKLKLPQEKVQDNLVLSVGDTGSSMVGLMTISALETANPGDYIMTVSVGYGCEAILFKITGEVVKAQATLKGIKSYLDNKRSLDNYTRYLAYKGLIPLEEGLRGENIAYTSMSVIWRQGREVSALVGSRCKNCGTVQFPSPQVCVNPECGASEFEPYEFADKTGKIVSFTQDFLTFSMDPPAFYGLVDMEGGGRLYLEFTDCTADQIKVGSVLEMTFRRKYVDSFRAHISYFWKAKPVM